MVDGVRRSLWTHWLLFGALAAFIVFVKLLPLNVAPVRLPGPDVLLLLTLAWVVRRPDYVPAFLIALVFLGTDILFMRPPGLWTAIVVSGCEYLRVRSVTMRDRSFLGEWLTAAFVISMMFLAQAALLFIFLVDQPALGLTLMHLMVTVASYPVVVVLAVRTFGLRKFSPGEVDHLGHKR